MFIDSYDFTLVLVGLLNHIHITIDVTLKFLAYEIVLRGPKYSSSPGTWSNYMHGTRTWDVKLGGLHT